MINFLILWLFLSPLFLLLDVQLLSEKLFRAAESPEILMILQMKHSDFHRRKSSPSKLPTDCIKLSVRVSSLLHFLFRNGLEKMKKRSMLSQ